MSLDWRASPKSAITLVIFFSPLLLFVISLPFSVAHALNFLLNFFLIPCYCMSLRTIEKNTKTVPLKELISFYGKQFLWIRHTKLNTYRFVLSYQNKKRGLFSPSSNNISNRAAILFPLKKKCHTFFLFLSIKDVFGEDL